VDTLVVRVAEDAYNGDAQFKVLVDGKQLGGIQTATASHAAGAWQDVTLTGAIGTGSHKVEIQFVNDAYAGSVTTDRNLYVDSVTLNGHHYDGASGTLDPSLGTNQGTAKALYSNGTLTFASVDAGSAALASASAPAAQTAAVIATPDAQPVPGGAHTYVGTNAAGVATGTTGADDLYASGAKQTLIGNGGNDIFHVGTYTDANIVVGSTGITAVETSADKYVLASGVNDLIAKGDNAHTLAGNAGHNWIVGGNGNDVLNGADGNDVLQVGTGASQLTGGAGKDVFMFSAKADQGNVIHDFTVGTDVIDLTGAMKSTGYAGSDPVADHYLSLVANSTGGTNIMIDPDGNGAQAAHLLVTVENVTTAQLHIGADYVWH
jgi:Ca2+-binding RTX toxin-like protein